MRRTGKRHTAVMAGFIGNVVEWYDFALYGYMAGIIADLFFPGEDSIAALIATYGVFAAGFLMRPLGSVVFGWLGDTLGRSATMLLSVSMMALPTLLLGCLPVYDTIGLWAPLLLVLIRLVQGLSVGGEFSSSVTYLVETAPRSRRGLAGSWANTGTMVGMLLGSAVAALTTSLIAQETLLAWGWRVPFLLGGILGVTSILMRRHLPKSEEFQRHHQERPDTSPLRRALTENRLEMVQAVVFASAYGALFYLPLVYLPEWLNRFTGLPLDLALRINTFATVLLLVLIRCPAGSAITARAAPASSPWPCSSWPWWPGPPTPGCTPTGCWRRWWCSSVWWCCWRCRWARRRPCSWSCSPPRTACPAIPWPTTWAWA
ncbi:Proline/betaine transporter [Alcanivorax sp. ALC70]|nr:Proline/betaine transporter [Alcanivorax sp. ALC70]